MEFQTDVMTYGRTDLRGDIWTFGRTCGTWVDVGTYRRAYGRTLGLTDGHTDLRTEERTFGSTYKPSNKDVKTHLKFAHQLYILH